MTDMGRSKIKEQVEHYNKLRKLRHFTVKQLFKDVKPYHDITISKISDNIYSHLTITIYIICIAQL